MFFPDVTYKTSKLKGLMMSWQTKLPSCLSVVRTGTTQDGHDVKIFQFHPPTDESSLTAWAKHFREHYCHPDEIDNLCEGFNCSREHYLSTYCFPSTNHGLGPSVRAGDFGEILVADYLQFVLNYTVPRTRYFFKENPDSSPQGVDVLGFQMRKKVWSDEDELFTFEVKCALVSKKTTTLSEAIADSEKHIDEIKKGEALNAMKQKLRRLPGDRTKEIALVTRFQSRAERPYKERSGAAAIHSDTTFNDDIFNTISVSDHTNHRNLDLIIIKGSEFMPLVHKLYGRAASEA